MSGRLRDRSAGRRGAGAQAEKLNRLAGHLVGAVREAAGDLLDALEPSATMATRSTGNFRSASLSTARCAPAYVAKLATVRREPPEFRSHEKQCIRRALNAASRQGPRLRSFTRTPAPDPPSDSETPERRAARRRDEREDARPDEDRLIPIRAIFIVHDMKRIHEIK